MDWSLGFYIRVIDDFFSSLLAYLRGQIVDKASINCDLGSDMQIFQYKFFVNDKPAFRITYSVCYHLLQTNRLL